MKRSRLNNHILIAIFLCLLLAGNSSVAGDNVAVQNGDKNTENVTQNEWDNFQPPRDEKYDWLQLVSGEWLKGEFIALYNFSVEFDSDELNLLTIDWKDVKQVRSSGPMSLQVEIDPDSIKTQTVIGVVQLKEDRVVVLSDGKLNIYSRSQIVSIATGSDKLTDLWRGKIVFGANIKKGNTDTVDSNLRMYAKRRTAESRFSIDYTGNYSRSGDVDTSNNHRITSYFDHFYNSRFFWRLYAAEYYRDEFRNIDGQISLGTSVGYQLIRTSATEWEVSAGLGALYKRFVSVPPGEQIQTTSPFVVFGTIYDTEVTSWMDYLLDFRFQLVDDESGSYNHHLVSTLSSDLIGDLDLDLTVIWDRVGEPQPEADNTVPDKDDFQLIVGISYEF
jgi:hypothetical protein